MFIDIMTQPGNGPLRGSLDLTFRDDALNARNPFTPVKGDESLQQGGVRSGGTIVPNKSSFSFTASGARQFDSGEPAGRAAGRHTARRRSRQPTRPDATSTAGSIRRSTRTTCCASRSSGRRSTSGNLGVGSFDLLGARVRDDDADNMFRRVRERPARPAVLQRVAAAGALVGHRDAVGDRGADRSRARRVHRAAARSRPAAAARTEFEAATDLDYVRGVAFGARRLLLEGGRYRRDEFSNYLGTFTFASLGRLRGRPAVELHAAHRRSERRYTNLQVGLYVQDDYRIAQEPAAQLRPALRGADADSRDQRNFSPRAGLTWSPFKSGKTTLRAGVGYFYGLARHQRLRADAAGRRLPPAGAQHPQSGVSRSGRRRHRRRRRTGIC